MPFPSRSEYERLVYGLIDFFPDVVVSSLRLYSTSALTAIVEGEITLRNGLLLRVLEVLDFKAGRIRNYSYAVYRNNLKIRWYDPQPHPENPPWQLPFPITSMKSRTSSVTGFPLPASPLNSRILLS